MAGSSHARSGPRCFAALLYSTKEEPRWDDVLEYLMQALVLGDSLHAHHPTIRRVMLLGNELAQHPLRLLLSTRWEVRVCRDPEFSQDAKRLIAGGVHDRIGSRVYMKLRVWEVCRDFEKVCFMDLDMLVVQAMDPVFSSKSPFSAVFRGATELTRPWQDRPQRSFYDHKGRFMYGINGGLFCLWPGLGGGTSH